MEVNIETRVKKIIREHLGVEDIRLKPEARFIEDLAADSLDAVELVMAIEEEFSIDIPDDHLEKMLTVEDAIKMTTDIVNG